MLQLTSTLDIGSCSISNFAIDIVPSFCNGTGVKSGIDSVLRSRISRHTIIQQL